MNIYIEITTARDCQGICAIEPRVEMEVAVGEGYDMKRLEDLRDRLTNVIRNGLIHAAGLLDGVPSIADPNTNIDDFLEDLEDNVRWTIAHIQAHELDAATGAIYTADHALTRIGILKELRRMKKVAAK